MLAIDSDFPQASSQTSPQASPLALLTALRTIGSIQTGLLGIDD